MDPSLAPAWLAPHLAPGERVRWAEEPGPEAWPRAVVAILVAAYFTFYLGFSKPSWWQFLPIWPEHVVSPTVGAAIAGVGVVADSVNSVLKHRYTAYAVTDTRLLRVPLAHPLAGLLPTPKPEAWPLAQARIVESERRRGGMRVRVQVESPAGRRLARFRFRAREGDAFRAALPRPRPSRPDHPRSLPIFSIVGQSRVVATMSPKSFSTTSCG